MLGKFNKMVSALQGKGLTPNVVPDAYAVAPQFDSTEVLRVEVDTSSEDKPVRYTSDVSLVIHNKDLASRAGLAIANKFGQNVRPASQIQQIMDKMSDDDLLQTVRSRHIQSPSELLAWSKDLMEQGKSLETEAQALIDEQTAKQSAENADAASAASASSE